MKSNPNLWRRTFWRWFPRVVGFIFDATMFIFIAAALAWMVYFGIMAP